jgi:amidase
MFLHTAKFLACTALLSSLLFLGTAWGVPNSKKADFPSLLEATTEELAEGLKKGLFTSVDLVNVSFCHYCSPRIDGRVADKVVFQAYTARILEVNDTFKAVVEINPDALSIAATLDAERCNGKPRGPLHGIPILVKNNIATADEMQNTAGSYALLGATVPRDSAMAAKLREAGAVILGKTNLSQWANFRSLNSSNGWSAYGGQTVGAYLPNQDPSGSSSGSGVASSLGLALAALGTETSGSILSPCEVGNLACVKPTVGLTSRALVVPISEHQDTVGPMARTIKDAAYLLGAIAGMDPNDNYTSAIPFKKVPDYVGACKRNALKGKRIGVPRNAIIVSDETLPVIDAFNAALALMEAEGAIIVDNTNFTGYNELFNSEAPLIVLGADFFTDLPELYLSQLATNPTGVQNVADVRNFTQVTPVEEYPDRDTGVFDEVLNLGFGNTDPRFWEAYQTTLRLAGPLGLTGALANYSLDAVVLPTSDAPTVPALLGNPVVTVPLGFYPPDTPISTNNRGDLNKLGPNLPFGLSFVGEKFSEELLIGLAYAFEQKTQVRGTVQPIVVPTTELVDVVGKKYV